MNRASSAILVCATLLLLVRPISLAQTVRSITNVLTGHTSRADLALEGEYLYAFGTSDPVGKNLGHRWQLFRWDLGTQQISQLTRLSEGIEIESGVHGMVGPSASSDGSKIVFVSRADPHGTNVDHGSELFLLDTSISAIVQLTMATGENGRIGTYRISGDGTTVVFWSDIDLLNGGPLLAFPQLFAVGSDGSNLRQLTTAGVSTNWASISHDGTRIAYSGAGGLRGILSDGTNDRLIAANGLLPVEIGADGQTIAYAGFAVGGCGGIQAFTVAWDGSALTQRSQLCIGQSVGGAVRSLDLSEMADELFYVGIGSQGFSELHRVDLGSGSGSSQQVVTGDCYGIAVSADAETIGILCGANLATGNLDASEELFTMNSSFGGVVQRSDGVVGGSFDIELSSDGTTYLFVSDGNPLNEASHPGTQLYWEKDGQIERKTSQPSEPASPSTSSDGRWVVFANDADRQLYLLDTVDSDQLQLISDGAGIYECPELSADGSLVVARRNGLLVGVDLETSIETQLTSYPTTCPRLDGGGGHVTVINSQFDLRKVALNGNSDVLLYSPASSQDIASAAGKIVFTSSADPVGTNPDANSEVFDLDLQTQVIRQLTVTTQLDYLAVGVSETGQYIAASRQEPGGLVEVVRLDAATLEVTVVSGAGRCRPRADELAIDASGKIIGFVGGPGCGEATYDGNLEVFAAEFEREWQIFAAETAFGTLLRWDAVLGASAYDVVRARLDDMSPSGEISMVTCIEDDSIDTTTFAFEDPQLPSPGEAIGYLARTQPYGDYGDPGTGSPRTVFSGDCTSP